MKKRTNTIQKGFTLIELMVSTLVFTLVLMAVTVALIQISRLYYRGVTQSRTQETIRNVSDEISQSIQFSAQNVTPPSYPVVNKIAVIPGPDIAVTKKGKGEDRFYFCVGPKRYSFAVDRMVTKEAQRESNKYSRHGLWVDVPVTGCANSAVALEPADLDIENPTSEGRELLQANMRISKLELKHISDELWTLNIAIAYGEEEFFYVNDEGRKVCEGSRIGVELCATSELSLTILRRVQ